MIQTMLARASGSSKESRLSQSVAMMLSYLTAITGAPFNIQFAITGILNASRVLEGVWIVYGAEGARNLK